MFFSHYSPHPSEERRFLLRPSIAAALLVLLVAAPSSRAQVPDLFISEYVEGSSFNKAIEIYNGTGAAVDLAAAGYRLEFYFELNVEAQTVIFLDGLIADGGVFVVADFRADPAIPVDQPHSQNFFNGNDAVVLARGATFVDSIGRIGELSEDELEWSAGGVSTLNHTLRRKSDVCQGSPDALDPFDPSLEWDEYPVDTFTGLGFHSISDPCLGPDECTPVKVLSCGSAVDSGRNDDAGSRRVMDSYPCLASTYRGSEIVYSFVAPVNGIYSVALHGLEADLDLVVLGAGRCDSRLCLASSDASGVGEEWLSFSAAAGVEYFIAVDGTTVSGNQGAASDYTVELTCPAEPLAGFTLSPEFPTAGQRVRFFDTSIGEPTFWDWDFGDGDGGQGRNPTHVFDAAGPFDVSLTVSNALGMDSTARLVVVAPGGASIVVSGPASGQPDEDLSFTATAAGCQADPAGWEWTTAGGEEAGGAGTDTIALRWPAGGVKTFTVVNSACGGTTGSHSVEIARQNGQRPQQPSDLQAEAFSATEIRLAWTDNAGNEEGFAIERQMAGGAFQETARVGANTTSAAVSVAGSLEPTTNPSTFRVKAFNAAGASSPTDPASALTAPETCDPAQTLCLLDKRFSIEIVWQDFAGQRGVGHPVQLSSDAGYFWFFNPDNVELVVKVIDGTRLTGHFWVYYGALSDVAFAFTVTDTETGNVKTYVNPIGRFASVGDVRALPLESVAGSHEPPGVASKGLFGVDFGWIPGQPVTDSAVSFEDRSQSPPAFPARTWEFGDSVDAFPADGIAINHLYSEPGTYEVTLAVEDLRDSTALREEKSQWVEVTPPPQPMIDIQGAPSARVGATVPLSATADQHCSPLRPEGWNWDVDGGAFIGKRTGSKIDVVWTTLGEKTVTASNDGCSTASGRHRIRIRNDAPPPSLCAPSLTALCLQGNRFRVEVDWRVGADSGQGIATPLTNETGHFWFFNPANVELVLKILDGRALNNHFWVYYGALSDVDYTITVIDTETGNTKRYRNPAKTFASTGDTVALPGS